MITLTRHGLLACTVLLVCTLLPGLAACGDGGPENGPAAGADPAPGPVYAQEVWIPYAHPSHKARPGVNPPPAEQDAEAARRLVEAARAEALGGVDVGYLAWRYSWMPAGFLGGFSGTLPRDANAPDVRDRTVAGLREGEIGPVHEWEHGFWFARRIDAKTAEKLAERQRTHARVRARARVIHVHHRGAHPARYEYDGVSRERALQRARAFIRQVQQGGDFAALARKHSNAISTKRTGGLLLWTPPGAAKPTDWMEWRARGAYHYHLYEAIFERAPVGRVHPEPVVSPMGVDVVLVLERTGR